MSYSPLTVEVDDDRLAERLLGHVGRWCSTGDLHAVLGIEAMMMRLVGFNQLRMASYEWYMVTGSNSDASSLD